MRFLLDTDICIFIIRKQPQSIFERLTKYQVGEIGISSITYSELCFGAFKSREPERNLSALEEFVAPLEILAYDDSVCHFYGEVRRKLELLGLPIGPMDTLIAAHALSQGLTLVTNNTAEFSRVEGLHVDNWMSVE
jgi:tRNA(fMet)-specific endonuclease VapC